MSAACDVVRRSVTALVVVLSLCGCSTIFAVKDEQKRADALCVLGGTVSVDRPASGPLVVALFTRGEDEFVLVDHFVTTRPGAWVFVVDPGTYWIAAFEDRNRDGAYDDEPFYRPDPDKPLVVRAGGRVDDLDIVIPERGRALRSGRFVLSDLLARAADEQQRVSLGALSATGKVTTLADPRFAREMAAKGMWQYYDFLLHTQPGIYFLEDYDPKRVPVLFVHGIGGTPLEFETLIAALDRKRFQPWVLYYPSGARLEGIVGWADQLLTRLEVEYRIRRAAVVAHSMGGLVARGLVLAHHETSAADPIRMLVTISSPLGGMPSAGAGVERSPIVVRSWYGLAPGSPWLEGLYYRDATSRTQRRRLPEQVAYHMLFGFRGDSGDGVVPIASQLRAEAQEEALTVRGYDSTHVGILVNPAAAARVSQLLGTIAE